VVGYDDTYSAMLTVPLLTTVHTSMHDIGRAAVDTLLRLHAGEKPFSHHLELATTLVERESTAPRLTSAPLSCPNRCDSARISSRFGRLSGMSATGGGRRG